MRIAKTSIRLSPPRALTAITAAVVCFWTFPVSAEWRPSDRFLHAVRHIESSGGAFVYGDDGLSLGDFQIRKAAWLDVSDWRKARGLKTYDYRKNVFNKAINRA